MTSAATHHSIIRRLSRNVAFMVADSAVANLASVGTTLAVSRLYDDPSILGKVAMLLTIASVGILLADLGNGQASTLLISRRLAGVGGPSPGRSAGAGLFQAAAGGLCLGVGVFFLPDLIRIVAQYVGQADRAREIADLRGPIRLVAVWVFLAPLGQQAAGVFAGFQKMQYTFIQDVSTQVPRLAICLAVAIPLLPWTCFIWGWTAWYFVAAAIGLGLLWRVLSGAGERLSLTGYAPLSRLRAGAALFTPIAAGFILQYLAIAIIWWINLGEMGSRSVGFFTPLWTLTRGYEVILIPLAIALFPAVSDAHGTRDPAVLTRLVRRVLLATGLVAVGILALFALAPGLLLGLFGADYRTMVIPLIVLAFGVALESQRCALDPLLNGSGLARWVTAIEWGKFALFLLLGIPLYRAHYLTGISLAFVGAFVPAWAAKMLLVRVRLGVRVLGPAAVLAVLLAAVAAAALVWRLPMIDFSKVW